MGANVLFSQSETKINLLRAFAGESQARNRYIFSAGRAKGADLYVIEQVFRYTADQEKEHAEIFYNYLKEFNGENIEITAAYPISNFDKIEDLLSSSQHNELEEADIIYPSFAKTAKDEGFTHIADTFNRISDIERIHSVRFGRFAEELMDDTLFNKDEEEVWVCQNCGYVHRGKDTPNICPVCSHSKGYFLRSAISSFGI